MVVIFLHLSFFQNSQAFLLLWYLHDLLYAGMCQRGRNCGTPTVNKQGCFGCGVCTRQAEEFPINILEFFYHLPLTFTDCLIIKLKQTLIKYVYSAFTYKWHKECVQYKQITSIISHQSIKWLTLCSCCLLKLNYCEKVLFSSSIYLPD